MRGAPGQDPPACDATVRGRSRSREWGAGQPSTKVRAGDRVEALIAERDRVVEVVLPIESRVGAPVAATCYLDHTPPPIVTEVRPGILAVRGEGRPSKRLRRELERLRRAPNT